MNDPDWSVSRALTSAQRERIARDRMVILGKLTAAAAHELNNPLSAILMYARLVEKELAGSPLRAEQSAELTRFSRQIQNEAVRCGEVVRNLLLLSRVPRRNLELCPVREILEQCLALVRHRLEMAHIDFEAHLPPAKEEVACDADELRQAFVGLLLNATETLPAGGKLNIRALPAGSAASVEISTMTSGIAGRDGADSSRDGGDETQADIQVPREIVASLGGTVEVETDGGGTATWRVLLPLAGSGISGMKE